MRLFVDASAAVAMLAAESDAEQLFARLEAAPERLFSAIAMWETAVALAKKRKLPVLAVLPDLRNLVALMDLRSVPTGEREAALALEAWVKYGKGSGQGAGLNLGDCFAYACAKANDARLLYKGDDFARTDLAWTEDA